MPFYTKRMVQYLQGKEGKSHKKEKASRALRTTPSSVGTDGKVVPPVSEAKPAEPIHDNEFDHKKLLFTKGLLKTQCQAIDKERCAGPAKGKTWEKYSILTDEGPVGESGICKVFKAKHVEFKDNILAARVYEGEYGIDPNNSLYLRILRHLGKKHGNIIQTWDIFVDDSNRLIIFQEFANRGSLVKYLESNNLNEQQVGKMCGNIYKALDYLGDCAISHRSLQPRHVLITLSHKDLRVKLTGFENAAIYWEPTKEDVKNIPCLPIESRPTDQPTFQAPEVYGNAEKEEFDPLVADVWSFGATIYYMFTKQYPFDFQNQTPEIGPIIQSNVDAIQGFSADGKKLLSAMLKPNANDRIHIDKLSADKWFKANK